MSKRVTFIPTKFIDVRTGRESLGYRAYDDHAQAYDNTWDSIPDNDRHFLRKVLAESACDVVGEMLDYCRQTESGLYVVPRWYDYAQIRRILTRHPANPERSSPCPNA